MLRESLSVDRLKESGNFNEPNGSSICRRSFGRIVKRKKGLRDHGRGRFRNMYRGLYV